MEVPIEKGRLQRVQETVGVRLVLEVGPQLLGLNSRRETGMRILRESNGESHETGEITN